MKINEIIHQKRLEQGFTQEQIASLLGVSTPAVNKWEKGLSYPDITLLPPLARLLNTDLNTLLSFQDDLSKKEVVVIMNKVTETFEEQGFQAGYELAMNKIKEFPNCDLLLLNMATLLDGGLTLYGKNIKLDDYEMIIESLYEKVVSSNDTSLKEQAQSSLINKLIQRKEYERAQAILDTISSDRYFDKKQIQANLYIAKNELDKAVKLIEENLLTTTNDTHSYLMTLMEIAIKQDRIEDAKYIANIDSQAAKLFDLWEYNQYVAHFQLYDALGNRLERIKILIKMLKLLTKKWDIHNSPLYRHIKTKEVDRTFGSMLQKRFLESIDDDEVIKELTKDPEIKSMIK